MRWEITLGCMVLLAILLSAYLYKRYTQRRRHLPVANRRFWTTTSGMMVEADDPVQAEAAARAFTTGKTITWDADEGYRELPDD